MVTFHGGFISQRSEFIHFNHEWKVSNDPLEKNVKEKKKDQQSYERKRIRKDSEDEFSDDGIPRDDSRFEVVEDENEPDVIYEQQIPGIRFRINYSEPYH
ncbi:MAG: hypothetical protein EZS28_047841, partial [Streblomastix strix]